MYYINIPIKQGTQGFPSEHCQKHNIPFEQNIFALKILLIKIVPCF